MDIAFIPEGNDGVQSRFYLKVQQDPGAQRDSSQIARAVHHYQQFAVAPSPDVTTESPGLTHARNTLDTSMVAAPASEFSGDGRSEAVARAERRDREAAGAVRCRPGTIART